MSDHIPVPNGEAPQQTRDEFMRTQTASDAQFYFRNPDNTYTNLGRFIDSGSTPYFLPQDDPTFNLIGEVQDKDKNNENYLFYYMFTNGNVSRSNNNLYYIVPAAAAPAAGGKKRKSKRSKSQRRKSRRSNSKRRMMSQRRK